MSSIERDFEDEAVVAFLMGAIDKANSMVQHIDEQTNILIGVGTAIFLFAASRFDSAGNKLVFLLLGIFAAASAVVGLYALHPPRFMRKKGQAESLIFPSNIARSDSANYITAMTAAVRSQGTVVEQCCRELYNISRYYYMPKRQIYRTARNILMAGIIVALLVFGWRIK